jgi:acyl-CoA thioester hydrolase
MSYRDFFLHETKIQIRFKDVDKQGHVNNANHLTYAETARVTYFREVLGKNVDWNSTGLLLARTEIDYIQPIFLEDDLSVLSSVTKLGTKSFDMENILLNSEEVVFAKVKSVFVCYDYHSKKSIPLPEDWRGKFTHFEKKYSENR